MSDDLTPSVDNMIWLSELRHRILHVLLASTSLFGTIAIIYSLFVFLHNPTPSTPFPYYLLAYGFILILTFARPIPDRWRAIGFLALLYFFACLSFYLGWLVSGGRAFLLAFVVGAAVLIGPRAGFVAAGLSFATYFVFGALLQQGWIELRSLPVPTSTQPIITEGLGFSIALGIVSSGLWFFRQALVAAAQAAQTALNAQALLDDRARQLDIANQLLVERTRSAEAARQEIESEAWQSAAQAALSQVIGGEQDLPTLATNVIRQLCSQLHAQVGSLFLAMEGDYLQLMGSYAYIYRKQFANRFKYGDGLVGQAALEKRSFTLTHVPPNYLPVVSGMMQVTPTQIVVAPFLFDDQVIGVVELGVLQPLNPAQVEFLPKALQSIGVAFHTARTRSQVNALLRQTQEQTMALQAREDALKSVNEELQAQTDSLRSSQDQLRSQQAALETSNVELEEQRAVLDQQNREMKIAQDELQRKTEELTQAGKYKSEFLANMSHELRTPLNSMLILARMFANNEDGNLTPDQVESARVIYNSGSDLLALINEILDLSKVEAGRMNFYFAPMNFKAFLQTMRSQFEHVAEEKKVAFETSLDPDLPEVIETDHQRVEQVVKNLLSNAFKFTERGSVRLHIERPPAPDTEFVAIRVIDTGIGMTPEQQARVFEAFQQADGSTSRKYGGTGLGLTISREFASRLGGKIGLESEYGKGSAFTLFLPLGKVHQATIPTPVQSGRLAMSSADKAESAPGLVAQSNPSPDAGFLAAIPQPARSASDQLDVSAEGSGKRPAFVILDDRAALQKGDKVLLIIEDDPQFAKIVMDYGHKKEFKCLMAADGEAGLEMARRYHPDAILLDLNLPGLSGWVVLDTIKQSSDLRHIPIHILSAAEETLDVYKRGALGFLHKPATPETLDAVFEKITDFISREIKNLLLVEDDAGLRHSVRQLLGGSDLKISDAPTGLAALDMLRRQHFDCMILDLTLPDMTGFELLNRMNQDEAATKCPVIVYTGKALSEAENAQLLKYADSVIIKGVKSPERLLDETALFLHRVVADLPEEKQRAIKRLHDREAVLGGKHILVVDDDMRNAFALSRLLTDKGLKVSIARSGIKALEILNAQVDPLGSIDLVLMDIMMPEMDGYETMQRIRAQDRFQSLPILALTAKAMKGDQEKCIAAGANDYLSKPIDADRLFSLLRVWLYR